jgi:hypothetical protein
VFKFKCDHGPHPEDYYLSMEADVEMQDGGRKRSAEESPIQTTLKRRATIDYEENKTNEFKVDHNLYRYGHFNE